MKLMDLLNNDELKEGLLNEEQKYEIKTRFGKFTIVHDENTTGPGFDPEYFVEVNLENQYLGHFMIAGDPRDKGAKGKITIHKGKKVVKLGHDK